MMTDRTAFDEKKDSGTVVNKDETKIWNIEKEINRLVELPNSIIP
jgi:hypothetical protein